MKKHIALAIGMLTAFGPITGQAGWRFDWDPVTGATKYPFFCEQTPVGAGPFSPIGEPAAPPFDASVAVPMTKGTQYECWVRASDGVTESSDSDHYVLTEPGESTTITLPAAPTTIRLEYQ